MSDEKLDEEITWRMAIAAELQRDLKPEDNFIVHDQDRLELIEEELEKLQDEQEQRRSNRLTQDLNHATTVQPLAATIIPLYAPTSTMPDLESPGTDSTLMPSVSSQNVSTSMPSGAGIDFNTVRGDVVKNPTVMNERE